MKTVSAEQTGGLGTRLFLALFFGVFLAVGGGLLYVLVARPVTQYVQARSWDAVPCRIISSEVHENSDSDGSTYRVDVRYSYSVGGQDFVGDRYRFLRFSSSGRDGKAKTVADLRANPSQTCWVNPANPSDAVLIRSPGWEMLFGIIPLIFFLVGLGGVYAAFQRGQSHVSAAVPILPDPQPHAGFSLARPGDGPAQLKLTQSRGVKFAAFALFAVFWNGILSVFLAQLFAGWSTGVVSLFLSLFLIPFVVVGIILATVAVYLGLQLTNPRPLLTVDGVTVPLGGELEVRWLIEGPVEKLQGFSIALEAREEATYRRDNNTRTDKQVFERLPVASVASPVPVSGRGRVTIPLDTMHTFATSNNKISWTLRVQGVIPKWPDVDDEFPITVAPRSR